MEKELLGIQLALFLKNEYAGSFELFSLKIKEVFGEPNFTQHLPVPQNIPADVPRLILKYMDCDFNISKSRIDIFSSSSVSINKKLLKLAGIVDGLNLKIGRVGLVKSFFSSEDINYIKTLLNEKNISNLDFKEINIRINVRSTIDSFECNNMQNITNGKSRQGGIEKEGVVVVRDVNTLQEEIQGYVFNESNILKIFEDFNIEADKLIYG